MSTTNNYISHLKEKPHNIVFVCRHCQNLTTHNCTTWCWVVQVSFSLMQRMFRSLIPVYKFQFSTFFSLLWDYGDAALQCDSFWFNIFILPGLIGFILKCVRIKFKYQISNIANDVEIKVVEFIGNTKYKSSQFLITFLLHTTI